MQVQVHSDNRIDGSARLNDWVSSCIFGKLERFDDDITRVVVHLNDENGEKAGPHDKRCQIEARAKGQAPVSVTHKAESLEFAVDGAIEKIGKALDHQFGKLRAKRAPETYREAADMPQDALLEEDFLENEQMRNA